MEQRRIATGIRSLDPIIKGGFPAGSFIVLLGEIGAGNIEFAYSSMILSQLEQKKSKAAPTIVEAGLNYKYSKKICYVSITRSKEDILNEIAFGFSREYSAALRDVINFQDFSKQFFLKSSVPSRWISDKISFEKLCEPVADANLLVDLVDFLEKNASDSLVILDSLTQLAQYCEEYMKWNELLFFLRALQKAAKLWNGVVYAVLSKNVFQRRKEESIIDCADGVLVFDWVETGVAQRQQIMYIKKFGGLLPTLEKDNIANFEIKIMPATGFQVTNVKQIVSFGR